MLTRSNCDLDVIWYMYTPLVRSIPLSRLGLRACTFLYAVTYASHCVNIQTSVPVLMITGPASGKPHLDVLNTVHSDVKCANATTYAQIAN